MTEKRSDLAHLPVHPQWTCSVDGTDWPCAGARKELAEWYLADRAALTAHLVWLMRRAADELQPANPARLFRRFVTWTLDDNAACRVCGQTGHDLIPGLQPRLVPCDGKDKVITPVRRPAPR